MNALKEFIEMPKEAASPASNLGASIRSMPNAVASKLPEAFGGGLGMGVAGAAVAGVGLAAQKIFDAVTKRRDFRQMLEFNPDLQEHQASNSKMFNQAFSTIRSMNPTFSRDPLVAGAYMRQLVQNPQTAGAVAGQLLQARGNVPAPMLEGFGQGAREGLRFQDPQKALMKDMGHQKDLETMRRDVRREGEVEHLQQTEGARQDIHDTSARRLQAERFRMDAKREGLRGQSQQEHARFQAGLRESGKAQPDSAILDRLETYRK